MSQKVIDELREGAIAAAKRGKVIPPHTDEILLTAARVRNWHAAKGKKSDAVGGPAVAAYYRAYRIQTSDWATLERSLDERKEKHDNSRSPS